MNVDDDLAERPFKSNAGYNEVDVQVLNCSRCRSGPVVVVNAGHASPWDRMARGSKAKALALGHQVGR